MRVLFVNCVCGIGSTGRIVTDLMQLAKEQGHTVRVACSMVEPIRGAKPDEVFVIGSKADYYVHNVLSRVTDHEGLYSVAATKHLIDRIREFDPEVVHLHNLHGHWINYELLFRYLSEDNKSVIWTLHDCWAFTGHCSHFSMLKCEQWKTHCSYCQGLRIYPMCYGKGDVSKNFDRKKAAFTSIKNMILVTPSEWLAGEVRRSFFKDYPVIAIPNGIDLNVFHPIAGSFKEKHGISDKKMILGVANVWSDKKGFADMLKLREQLDDSYSMVIVGLTEKQLKTLPSGIIGILRTANVEELAEIYSAADVFVNPSYEETMGLVTAEALACGTPAVVYNKTAVPEVVDNNSGVVVNAGNILELKTAIEYISNHANQFQNMLCRAKSFEKHKQYEQYLSLYK